MANDVRANDALITRYDNKLQETYVKVKVKLPCA
jgi:hypothetical protein